jgi:hypothetical protein
MRHNPLANPRVLACLACATALGVPSGEAAAQANLAAALRPALAVRSRPRSTETA